MHGVADEINHRGLRR